MSVPEHLAGLISEQDYLPQGGLAAMLIFSAAMGVHTLIKNLRAERAQHQVAADGSPRPVGDVGANPEGAAASREVSRTAAGSLPVHTRNDAQPAPAGDSPVASSPESRPDDAAQGRAGESIEKCSGDRSEHSGATTTDSP